ncbi:MAG: RNA ligase family protein [archaeon]|nr:RNA ligase family protein [archaeon]
MTFIKYQHVQHIDSDESEGLLDGTCYIFPKLDGSNCGAYTEEGQIRFMSRNCVLDDQHPFSKYVLSHENIIRLLKDHPELRLYGEWMKPHIIRSYTPDTWDNWFVFDVCVDGLCFSADIGDTHLESNGVYHLPYDIYSVLLDHYGIAYIPVLRVIDRPCIGQLKKCADEENTWHITEGQGCGEGIVIKRYDFLNKYGRPAWAKVLNTAFFQKKNLLCRRNYDEMELEEKIVDKYVTQDLVNKEYLKIAVDEGARVHSARLLGIMWKTFLEEYLWDILKKFHDPVIDFRKLRKACDRKVKENKPELFGGTVPADTEEPDPPETPKVGPDYESDILTIEFTEEEEQRLKQFAESRNMTPGELLEELAKGFLKEVVDIYNMKGKTAALERFHELVGGELPQEMKDE